MVTDSDDKTIKRLVKLMVEAVRRFPDDEERCIEWWQEHMREEDHHHPIWKQMLTVKLGEAAVDAFEMFPDDEAAGVEWLRETLEGQGCWPPDVSEEAPEMCRQAYRLAKQFAEEKEVT
jgi:hypothetical protein